MSGRYGDPSADVHSPDVVRSDVAQVLRRDRAAIAGRAPPRSRAARKSTNARTRRGTCRPLGSTAWARNPGRRSRGRTGTRLPSRRSSATRYEGSAPMPSPRAPPRAASPRSSLTRRAGTSTVRRRGPRNTQRLRSPKVFVTRHVRVARSATVARRPVAGEVAGRGAQDESLARQEPARRASSRAAAPSRTTRSSGSATTSARSAGEDHLQPQVRETPRGTPAGAARCACARTSAARRDGASRASRRSPSRDGGVGFARQADQRGAALEVGPPGRRQPDLARGPLEQPRAQARLERRQLPAHGRLGSREALRRRGEASRLDDGDEHLDVLDAGHERSIHTLSA